MNYSHLPSEISLGGIYFPPLLFAVLPGVLMAWIITRIFNRLGLAEAERLLMTRRGTSEP